MICKGCLHIDKLFLNRNFTFIYLLLFLTSCGFNEYPEDYEQLNEDERIVIRFSHVVGENTPKGLASRYFAEQVKERTNGYVEVQVFPNSNLYKDGEELDALLEGDIQMIAPATSKVTSLVPEWEVIDLPFAFQSVEEVQEFLKSPTGIVLKKKLEEQGLYPMAFWDNGFKQMTNTEGPLITPKDFKGLKFRVMSSEVLIEQFDVLGASAKIKTFDEVYKNLNNNKANAQENTFSNIVNKNFHGIQNYLTVSNHGYLGYLVLMNDEFWHSLPDDIQVIILEVLEDANLKEKSIAKEVNQESYDMLKNSSDIEIYELSEQEQQLWEDALTPVYEYFTEKYGAQYIKHLPKYQKYKGDGNED